MIQCQSVDRRNKHVDVQRHGHLCCLTWANFNCPKWSANSIQGVRQIGANWQWHKPRQTEHWTDVTRLNNIVVTVKQKGDERRDAGLPSMDSSQITYLSSTVWALVVPFRTVFAGSRSISLLHSDYSLSISWDSLQCKQVQQPERRIKNGVNYNCNKCSSLCYWCFGAFFSLWLNPGRELIFSQANECAACATEKTYCPLGTNWVQIRKNLNLASLYAEHFIYFNSPNFSPSNPMCVWGLTLSVNHMCAQLSTLSLCCRS